MFRREKKDTMDRQEKGSWQLTQVESDLNTANAKIKDLHNELQNKQTQVLKLEAAKVGQSVRSWFKGIFVLTNVEIIFFRSALIFMVSVNQLWS